MCLGRRKIPASADRTEPIRVRITVTNTARNYGGQEAMAVAFAVRLAERRHRVHFLCRPVFPALDTLPDSVTVSPVLGGLDWGPVGILRARRALRAHGSQVLLATTNKDMRSAALAARSLGIPVVVRRAMARPMKGSLHYRLLYGRLPAHTVTNSEATRQIMLTSAPWLDPSKLSVIHNGIDPAPFQNTPPLDLGLPADAVVVGFVGRFVDWKGVLTLADAWRLVEPDLPNAHLVLAGEGECEGEMRARLDEARRVHWIGFRDDVPAVMRALDVLAFPSVMEGFGIAAVEAMAAGVPVIGGDAAALPEVVGHEEQGLLVPPHHREALMAAIMRLVRDPDLRRTLGEAGRRRVEREFTEARMIDEYERVLAREAKAP
jgi:glycosyltransferase involved in cell wall biosynthesis